MRNTFWPSAYPFFSLSSLMLIILLLWFDRLDFSQCAADADNHSDADNHADADIADDAPSGEGGDTTLGSSSATRTLGSSR